MRKQTLVQLIGLLCLFSTPALSQSNYSLEISSKYSFNISAGLLKNWSDGLGVGLGMSHNLSERIQLVTDFSYQHLTYRGGNVMLVYPEYKPTIKGEATNIYEMTLVARVKGKRQTVNPFLSLSGGIQIVDVGQIRIDEIHTYGKSGRFMHEGIAGMGLGLSMSWWSNICFLTEARVIGTSNKDYGFAALMSSIQFAL